MRRALPWVGLFALFLAVGVLADQSWRRSRLALPEIGRRELEPTVGQGVLLGVLGGTVVAPGFAVTCSGSGRTTAQAPNC